MMHSVMKTMEKKMTDAKIMKITKQDEDAEEIEQSGYTNEGHGNDDCIVDDELDVLPFQGSKSKVWSYFSFPADIEKTIRNIEKR